MITVTREGDDLVVDSDDSVIRLSELRVRPSQRAGRPHQLMGKAGSSMTLTDEELVNVVIGYLREVTDFSDEYIRKVVRG